VVPVVSTGTTLGDREARVRGRKKKENLKALLFVGPMLLIIVVVYAFPLIQNANYSLRDLSMIGRPLTGLRNYRLMLTDPIFLTSIRNNFILIFTIVPILVFLSLALAGALFERIRGWKFYRGTILLPYITSITAVGLFYSLFFQGRGMLNTFLKLIHLDVLVVDWLGSTQFALPAIMFVIVWREFGFGTMLFLARLTTVPEELFDAAKIDGANWFQRLFHIVIPQLATVIEFYVFLMIVTMLSWVFNYVYVMTLGGPARSTYVTELYIFIEAFKMNKMGVAAAVSIVIFAITAVLAFASLRFRTRLYKEYE
jgi:ABC-type sugar transport system permease subunit